MRAATWASSRRLRPRGVPAPVRRRATTSPDATALTAIAASVGLGTPAFDDPAVKAALRAATDAAWDAGVRGIPSLQVGDAIFYGDDQLESAIR